MDILFNLVFLVMLFTTCSVIGNEYGRSKLHRPYWSSNDFDMTSVRIKLNKNKHPVAKPDMMQTTVFGILLPMFAMLYGLFSLVAWYGITDALAWLTGYKPVSLFSECRNGETFQILIYGLTMWVGFWHGRSRIAMFAALKAIAYAENQRVKLNYKSVFLMCEEKQR